MYLVYAFLMRFFSAITNGLQQHFPDTVLTFEAYSLWLTSRKALSHVPCCPVAMAGGIRMPFCSSGSRALPASVYMRRITSGSPSRVLGKDILSLYSLTA